ncbi:MAG: ribonuclease Z [Desulfurococcaceae archaeon TW002]
MVEVVFLGVGGWLSNPFYGQSGILVLSSNKTILLDAGEGTLERLYKCVKIDVNDLDYIILTHTHGDHVLGLPTIAQHLRRSVKVIGLRETLEDLRKIFEALHVENKLQQLTFKEIPPEGFEELEGRVRLKWVRAKHVIPSISVVLEIENVKIAYSGDTSYNPEFLNIAKHVDLLIHEFSIPQDMQDLTEVLGHTAVTDFERVVRVSRPKCIAPIHYYLEAPKLRLESIENVELVIPAPCSKLSF